jgi:predicted metal-dependent peptidase
MNARDKRVELAQTRIALKLPFFAPGVCRLPVVFDDAQPTASTDGTKISFNTRFFDGLSDPVLATVMCHEVGHCLLGHLWRIPGGGDWDVWNQATDHAVNLMLKEWSATVTVKGLADPFPFPDPQEAYLSDPRYAGQCEEAIYSSIMAQPKGQSKPNPNGKPGNGQGGGQSKQGGIPAPSSMPSFGQIQAPPGKPAGLSKQVQTDWQHTLIQSCKIAQGRGDLPGSLAQFVDQLVNPQISWQELLRSFLREQCSDDWDFLTPALEWESSGFILPSLRADKVGDVVFATDTSGSTCEWWAQFQGEKQQCLDDLKPRLLVDIYCDDRVQDVREYSIGDTVSLELPGGGGTSFIPVFDEVEQRGLSPKCLVYLTDGDGSFPAVAPSYPVLWIYTGAGEAPFGTTVYANK